MAEWLDRRLAGKRIRKSGISRYETDVRVHLKPHIADRRLDRLRVSQLSEMFTAITDANAEILEQNAQRRAADLTSRQASPQRIAKIIRSQWVIENRLHFVRDTTFAEDASKIHTGHGPDNMATLRSFAINHLRNAGHTNIAAGIREMSYEPFIRPLDLLKIG